MVAWTILCLLVGYCAHRRGRNMWLWALAAFFISPVLAGIALAVMKDLSIEGEGELDEEMDEEFDEELDEENEGDAELEVRCPECHCMVKASKKFCPRCGQMLW